MCVWEREGERDRDREKNRENDLWCSMGILISQWIAQMGSFLALAKLKNIWFEKKEKAAVWYWTQWSYWANCEKKKLYWLRCLYLKYLVPQLSKVLLRMWEVPEPSTADTPLCWFLFLLTIFFCDYNKLWKILQEMAIRDHLTCLLRNLYAGQEAIVRTGHGIADWLQIWKGVCQGCTLSLCLFNLYAQYIMRNAGLEEAQAGITIAAYP